MSSLTQFKLLQLFHQILNIYDGPVYQVEQEDDSGYVAEIEADGKLIQANVIGYGETKEEALDDASDRFFSVTPMIDNVPTSKLINLLQNTTLDREDL